MNGINFQTPSQENMLAFSSIASLILAYQNLLENREQTAHNDVQRANDEQERHILTNLNEQFSYQNKMLKDILFELRRLNYFLERSDYNA